jgi:hypothetical protein
MTVTHLFATDISFRICRMDTFNSDMLAWTTLTTTSAPSDCHDSDMLASTTLTCLI